MINEVSGFHSATNKMSITNSWLIAIIGFASSSFMWIDLVDNRVLFLSRVIYLLATIIMIIFAIKKRDDIIETKFTSLYKIICFIILITTGDANHILFPFVLILLTVAILFHSSLEVLFMRVRRVAKVTYHSKTDFSSSSTMSSNTKYIHERLKWMVEFHSLLLVMGILFLLFMWLFVLVDSFLPIDIAQIISLFALCMLLILILIKFHVKT